MSLDNKAFENRSNLIGGSEVATVLGLNPWMTPAALMAKKISGQYPQETPEKRRIMQTGKAMEDAVLEFFAEANPHRRFEVVAREPQYIITDGDDDVIIVTHPDVMRREVDPTGQRSNIRLLEIKTTTGWRDDISERTVPKEYSVQVQMQMHAAHQSGTPVDVVDLAIYNLQNGKLHCHTAVYDKKFCERAVAVCKSFKDALQSDRSHEELVKSVAGPQDNVVELLQIVANEDTLEIGDDADQLSQTVAQLSRWQKANNALGVWNEEMNSAKADLANTIGDKRCMEVFGSRVLTYGNVAPSARNAKTVRRMEKEFSSPDTARLMAQAAASRLGHIDGVNEGRLDRRARAGFGARLEEHRRDGHRRKQGERDTGCSGRIPKGSTRCSTNSRRRSIPFPGDRCSRNRRRRPRDTRPAAESGPVGHESRVPRVPAARASSRPLPRGVALSARRVPCRRGGRAGSAFAKEKRLRFGSSSAPIRW